MILNSSCSDGAHRLGVPWSSKMSQNQARITPRHSRPSKASTEISATCFISGI